MKLVTMLQCNIPDAICANHTRLVESCNIEIGVGDIFEKKVCDERVKKTTDAAVIALNEMSSPRMHKQVIIEDVIGRCIGLTRILLVLLIFPASDSIYKMANTTKRADRLTNRPSHASLLVKSIPTQPEGSSAFTKNQQARRGEETSGVNEKVEDSGGKMNCRNELHT